MTSKYDLYFNINYQCNCECLFCASDLTLKGGRQNLAITFHDYENILNRFPEGLDTLVAISGGEPTIHKEIEQIIRLTKKRGHLLNLFTNGRRFSSRKFADQIIENFKGTLLVPLYTMDAKLHDILTGSLGSFEETLSGLETIESLRKGIDDVRLQIKLLFFKPNEGLNLNTLNCVLNRFPEVDTLSLHSFIQSNKAQCYDFVPSLDHIRQEVNKILDAINAQNFNTDIIDLSDIPPCVLSSKDKNLYNIRRLDKKDEYKHVYFDPFCLEGEIVEHEVDAICSTCSRCEKKSTCCDLVEIIEN